MSQGIPDSQRLMRMLGPGDETRLEDFLAAHADSSMSLRENLLRAGLRDDGGEFAAAYAASFVDGRVCGVAALCSNGMLLLQAPTDAAALARLAAEGGRRAVTGALGPCAQVDAAFAGLGLESRPLRKRTREDLFGLSLRELVVPACLTTAGAVCRRASAADLPVLAPWRHGYEIAVRGAPDSAATRVEAERRVAGLIADGDAFLLEVDGRPAAFCAISARLHEIVQIGGVWTPPALRGRGFARGAVAGALMAARAEGARRAVLFTSDAAARRSYEAVGFRRVGDFGIALFAR